MKVSPVFMLIHGFGGGPFELVHLKNALGSQGFVSYDLVLPGHLQGKRGLRSVSYKEWLKSVEKKHSFIKESHPTSKLIVVGFSMGGLLGAHLAKNKNIDGLITLNTPIFYWNLSNVLRNLGMGLSRRDTDMFKRYLVSCTMYPVNALYQFRRLLGLVRPYFKTITCPLLVIQTLDDDAVHHKSASHIIKSAQSEFKKCIYMNEGGHGLLMGPQADEATGHVIHFIKDLLKTWK